MRANNINVQNEGQSNVYRPQRQKLFRGDYSNGNPVYLTFEQRVEQSPYLVSLEDPNAKNKKAKKPKKEIISYVANKDKLFIPKPERQHQPIDITKNLVEEEKKVVTADLGIQSDEIEYVDPDKGFIPQKIGKDQSTQILDGELFNFDEDVKPLLTVIVGKTLEQSLLEIGQEDEIATLRDAKAMYQRKKNDDDKRLRNLEDREIQLKFNHDTKKEKRRVQRELRKTTQRELISRVMSKAYLKNLKDNSIKDLIRRGQFRNYTSTTVKNISNSNIKIGSEKLNNAFKVMQNFLESLREKKHKEFVDRHIESVANHREYVRKYEEQCERKRKEAEEQKLREEMERKERRRKRREERIKKEIKASIVDNGKAMGEALNEEFTEIGNFGNDTTEPYIGIYGGLMGMLMAVLSFSKRDCYEDESLYNVENVNEILQMVFDSVQGTLNLHFKEKCGEDIKAILKKYAKMGGDDEEGGIDLNNLKSMNDLDSSVWEKISEILCDVDNNTDIYLTQFIKEYSQPKTDEEGNEIPGPVNSSFYSLIIKTLIDLITKSSYTDHFNFIFDKEAKEEGEEGEEEKKDEEEGEEEKKVEVKEETFEDKLKKYEAICMFDWKKPYEQILEEVEYVRGNKRKTVPAPEFESDMNNVTAYQNNPESHNVLLWNRVAEFIIRNKIFECTLAHFSYTTNNEIDTKPAFEQFNHDYDEMINNSVINNTIQIYHYAPEPEKEEEEEEKEEE